MAEFPVADTAARKVIGELDSSDTVTERVVDDTAPSSSTTVSVIV